MVFFRFTATYVTLKKQWVKKLEKRIGYHKHSKHFLPIEYTKIPRRPNLEKSSSTITVPSTYIKKRRKSVTRKKLAETVQTFHKKIKIRF